MYIHTYVHITLTHSLTNIQEITIEELESEKQKILETEEQYRQQLQQLQSPTSYQHTPYNSETKTYSDNSHSNDRNDHESADNKHISVEEEIEMLLQQKRKIDENRRIRKEEQKKAILTKLNMKKMGATVRSM